MDIDFHRLKVFYYIFSEGGVASAAQQLHVTQSAVSQHLGKLEQELKVRLFTRLHKRLVPTAAGKALFRVVGPFVQELSGVVSGIHRSRKGPAGTLRVGAPAAFGEKYMPAIFAPFRKTYPEVDCRLELGHPTVLLPMVADGRLDFAVADIFSGHTAVSAGRSLFSVETVAEEELILAGDRDYCHRNLGRRAPDLDGLIQCDYIAYQPRAPAVRSWFKHHFNTSVPAIRIAMTVESVRAVITGMKSGLGLGIVPSHTIGAELKDGTLVQVRSGKGEMVNRISLVQLQDKVPSLTERMFIRHFKRRMGEVMPERLASM